MPGLNLLKILYPRRSSDSVYQQLSDSFRLREQTAELYSKGEINNPEVLDYLIEKNRKDLMSYSANLNTNQARDLESQIVNLEIKKEALETKKALDTKNIEKGLEQSLNLLKKQYVSNPYEYIKKAKEVYDAFLKGNQDLGFEGILTRIVMYKDAGFDVNTLEDLARNFQDKRSDLSIIQTALEMNDQRALDRYQMVYDLNKGRVRDFEIMSSVRGMAEEGLPTATNKALTDVKVSKSGEKSILSTEAGLPLYVIDTEQGKPTTEKQIAFGYSPFFWMGSSKETGMPSHYAFGIDVKKFSFDDLENEGIQTRSSGDFVVASDKKIYYVDKNRDLRPVLDDVTLITLGGKRKGMYVLTPEEEERLPYLVKEPVSYTMGEAQQEALSGLYQERLYSGMFKSPILPEVPFGGFRPREYELRRQKVSGRAPALRKPTGEAGLWEKTKSIFKGAF